MQSFEWLDVKTVDEALRCLSGPDAAQTILKAGGMDVLDLMKEGILSPKRVVNIRGIDALHGVRVRSDAIEIGALTTLSDIAKHDTVRASFGALVEAIQHAATPQIRNVATLGGNLLQRPRCWYFRNALLHKVPEDIEHVKTGAHQYHAIFNNSTNAMVHASTLATALIAYDASVHLVNSAGRTRALSVEKFLLPPSALATRDADLAQDEMIVHIEVPLPKPETRSAYFKQTERDSYDWPLFDIAVVMQLSGHDVAKAAVIVGSVAPTPMRAVSIEQGLQGLNLTEPLAKKLTRALLSSATPFERNAYKVTMLEAVLPRVLLSAVT